MSARLLRGLLILAMGSLLAGCTDLRQYRTAYAPCDPARSNCADAAIEEGGDTLLGIVEFDDQGWLWDRGQMEAVLEQVSREARDRPLLIVVFVHGWKHNARDGDDNLLRFKHILRLIYQLESAHRPARRVAGVYVGWRGLSVREGFGADLTFWDRKNTAEKIGHGGVTELLVRLEGIQAESRRTSDPSRPDTQLIVMGHSFGGDVVYSALSQILVERFPDPDGPKIFGNLVVLLNPAFEAARFTPLWQMGAARHYRPGQLPILAILTSQGDWATKYAFPFGRWFSTFFEQYRNEAEEAADRRAVGHYRPYTTHALTATCPDDWVPKYVSKYVLPYETPEPVRRQWDERSQTPGWKVDFSCSELRHVGHSDPLDPLLVISVDNRIITGHDGIDNPVLVAFLRQFIFVSTR